MIYGYARVSTDGQSVDTQVHRLRTAGARKVFREAASGVRAGADRPQLRKAIASWRTAMCCWSSGSIGWRGRPAIC